MRFIVKLIWKDIAKKTTIPFKVVFSNGSFIQSKKAEPEVTIIYKKPIAEWKSLIFADEGIVDSYIKKQLDIKGSIPKLLLICDEYSPISFALLEKNHPINRIRNFLHEIFYGNWRISQAKNNARFHYNNGLELYQRYLDPTMTYSCAYWKEGTNTLAQAQMNKIEHVC